MGATYPKLDTCAQMCRHLLSHDDAPEMIFEDAQATFPHILPSVFECFLDSTHEPRSSEPYVLVGKIYRVVGCNQVVYDPVLLTHICVHASVRFVDPRKTSTERGEWHDEEQENAEEVDYESGAEDVSDEEQNNRYVRTDTEE